MGYMAHDAIIVTSWNSDLLNLAAQKAKDFGLPVAGPVLYKVNGGGTFLIAPDGSKEGWSESDHGDGARAAWLKWAEEQAYEDGSNALDYVAVRFGGDFGEEHGATITFASRTTEGEV